MAKTRVSNQASFDTVDLADCIVLAKDEKKETAMKDVAMAMRVACDSDVKKKVKALRQAQKVIKEHIPDFDSPIRVVVAGTGVIEVSPSDRDGFEVAATTIYRKASKLD